MKLFVAKLPHLLAVKKSLGNRELNSNSIMSSMRKIHILVLTNLIQSIFFSLDMTIAEMIKDVTKSDEFGDLVKNEHEMILGSIGDRINPYVEDLMAHKADLVKVS